MNSLFIRLGSGCVLGLIFMSQFVPTAYTELKAVFLIVGFSSVVFSMLRQELFLLRWHSLGMVFLAACGLSYSAYGLMRGNPGAVRVLSVWFAWPLVYLFLSTLLRQPNGYLYLSKTLVFSLACVVLYGYMYLGYAAGFVPDWLYFELKQGQSVGFYDGFVEYNLYSVSSLIFLAPFYFHYLFERYKRVGRVGVVASGLAVATIILIFLTGRRALLVSFLLLPILIIFSNKLLGNNFRLTGRPSAVVAFGFLVFIAAYAFLSFGLRYDAFVSMVLEGFNFSSMSGSASERTRQFFALIDGWLGSSIMFGAGNGAVAAISRSDEFPWAYELTYVYLLFSTGLVGVLVYFSWYGYSLIKLRMALRNRRDLVACAAPMLTASLAFCIAAGTNPYFGKFDYLWVVLLPYLISAWARFQRVMELK